MTRTSKLRFKLLAIFCCLLFTMSLIAQNEVTLHIDTEYSTTKARTKIRVENFTNMLGFQFSVNWNPNTLSFIDAEGALSHNANSGVLTVIWTSNPNDPNGVSIDDGDAILEINFDNIAGTTMGTVGITENPIIIEFVKLIDNQPTIVPVIINGESITEGTFVTGRVTHDVNENCALDANENNNLVNWRISIDDTYATLTDSEGYYSLFAPIGNHVIEATPPNELWESCLGEIDFATTTIGDITEINFPAQVVYACPELNVNISAPLIRRCFENFYYVNYCNRGSEIAANAYIEVLLDDDLEYLESSIPYTTKDGNLLTFELGDMGINACGDFHIKVQMGCEDVGLGETHCTEALIFPNDPCIPTSPDWSGASIQLRTECDGDNEEVIFYIENVGAGDMTEQGLYIVIEDDIIMRNNVPYQLNSGETLEVKMEANGKTYRIETNQVPSHPGMSMPSLAIEGCGRDEVGEFSTGFVMQFDQDDANAFVSIDCQENIGAYDPNDKQGFPYGVSENHYIEENTTIEYFIRFQNTGTDTAFNIVVRDTLTEFLNPNTIRLAATSHPVDFVQEDNILIFNFDDIMLPDSNINEAASHGFIRFHVTQTQDNPLGTMIENEASIYFDFNDPIVTNTTLHTIGEDFIEIDEPTNINTTLYPNLVVKTYPNPFTEWANIELEGVEEQDIKFYLYDNTGRLLRTESFNDTVLEFHSENLTSGTYHYEIRDSKNHFASGQMIIQKP